MRPTFQPSQHSGSEYGEVVTVTLALIGAAGAIGAGAYKYAGAKKVAAAERVSQARDEAMAKEAIRSQERVAQLQTLVEIKNQQVAERTQQFLLKGILIVVGIAGAAYFGLKALKPHTESGVETEE